jgi:hypothetical protein
MSTLRVSTIQDTAGSNSSTPAAIANGIAKAWVNFNGTGVVAIRAQYNVSSITDNGTGNYRVNFTNALSDANYGVSFAGGKTLDDESTSGSTCVPYPVTRNASYVGLINVAPSNGVYQDSPFVSISVFR